MELLNRAGVQASMSQALDEHGALHALLLAKAAFSIPQGAAPGNTARWLEEPVELLDADVFEGEPGHSALRYPADRVLAKDRCDVFVNGAAYARGGRPASSVCISLRAGRIDKALRVTGARHWEKGLGGLKLGPAQAFDRMPLSYAIAYGGEDRSDPDPAGHGVCEHNPVGRGYFAHRRGDLAAGHAATQTEDVHQPADDPWQRQVPLSLGALGRNWQPRLAWAGTYDEAWRRSRAPLLPQDFDRRHHQVAPWDQQCDWLRGGEAIELLGLTPDGHRQFRLPEVLTLQVRLSGGTARAAGPVALQADTLCIEPGQDRLSITWRASWLLSRRAQPGDRALLERASKHAAVALVRPAVTA